MAYSKDYEKDTREISIKLVLDGKNVNPKLLVKAQINEVFNQSENITFGNFCTNSFNAELFSDPNVKFAEKSKVELFSVLDNIETPLGIFYVSEITDSKKKLNVSGYDISAFMLNDYAPTIQFPNTIENVVKDICNQCNVTLDFTFPNIQVEGYPGNTQCKVMIGYLAGLMGMNAYINPLGRLTFKWYTETDIKIFRKIQFLNGYKQIADKVIINSITCTVGDTQISSGEGMGISIENPLMNQSLLDSILNKIKILTYTPCTIEFRGNPTIDVGSIVLVETDKGVYIKAIVSKRDTTIGGGMKSTITSIANNQIISAISKSPIEIKLKKLYNTLQEGFKESTETILGHNGGNFVVDLDSNGKPTGWTIMDTPALNETTHLWKMTMGGFGYSSNGGKTFEKIAIDMNGNINAFAIRVGIIQGDFFDIDLNTGTLKMGLRNQQGEIDNPDFYIDHNGVVIFNAIKELEKKIEAIETNTVSASISASNNATLNVKNTFVTLKAKVVLDGKDITTDLTDLSFIWHRVSGNKDQDTEWDQNHNIGSKELNIGYNDVDLYANFYCTVTTTYGVFVSNYLSVTDETDVSNLQVYISANQPTYQEYNGSSHSPDWTTSGNLILTPVILDNFLNVHLSDCTITWKKTTGELDPDEVVTDGILTVSSNKLNTDIKDITYVCDVQYHYSALSQTITFTSCKDQEESVVGDVTYYTWVYFADNSNGDGISKTSVGKSYIGVANMQTEKEPPYETNEEGQKVYTDLSAFTWTKMVDFNTVLRQEGEPNDTTVLWLDTTTGQLKKYYQFLQAWAPIDSETSIRDNAENVFVTTEKSNNANFTVLSNSIAATVKSVEKVSSDLGSQLEELSTKQEQTDTSVNTTISKVTELTDSITGLVTKEEFHTYFKFQEDGLHISKSQGSFEMVLSDTELAFYEGGTRVAYISNKRLYIEQVVVVQSLQVGDYLLRYDNDVGFIIQ